MSALLQIVALAAILAINNFFGAVSLGATPLDRRRRWGIIGLFTISDCGLPLIGVLLGASLARALGPAAADVGIALIMLTGAYLVFGMSRQNARGHSGRAVQRLEGPRPPARSAEGRDGRVSAGAPPAFAPRRVVLEGAPPALRGGVPASRVGGGAARPVRAGEGSAAALAPEAPAPAHPGAAQVGIGPLVLTAAALGLDNLGAAIGLGATGVNVPLTLVTFGVVTGVVTAGGLAVGGLMHRRLPSGAAGGIAGVLLFGTGCAMLVSRLHRG